MNKDSPLGGGASFSAVNQPAISLIRPMQGGTEISADPIVIGRMLQEVFQHEKGIKSLEDKVKDSKNTGGRLACIDGEVRRVPLAELARRELVTARQRRDEHLDAIKQSIDYALTTAAYADVPCPSCRLPQAPLEFIKAVGEFQPANKCNECLGRGTVRVKKQDPQSTKDFERVSYFNSVLDDVVLCAKIRACTSDADDAYTKLEQKHIVLMKFGNENQTHLEGEDAQQGVRHGLIEAARRFDPSRGEGAVFQTVAYNWCFRQTRARVYGQRRAGVYAPSADAIELDEDGTSAMSAISSRNGSFGSFKIQDSDHTVDTDVREKVALLPSLERTIIEGEMAGRPLSQIAAQLGLPKPRVRYVRDRAYDLLRYHLRSYETVSALSD